MANPIRRIVQLILDKAAADRAAADAKQSLSPVDDALGKLKGAARALGATLAAAFAVGKVKDFLAASVKAASESGRQYAQLGATIDATGASYADLEASVIASANAFEAATIHDDGEYAEGLQRVVAISGDVQASMRNMGLVADVAAQFFDGELGPAADVVARAMNGDTRALKQLGIEAKSAQEALDILAARSMGAAEARANSFEGRVAQLNNAWGNFQKEVGLAVLSSEGATMATSALAAGVQFLRDWVDRNKEAIADWTTKGIKVAIDATDVLLRALLGVGSFVKGGLNGALGLGAKGIAFLATGYAIAIEAAGKFMSLIGASETADGLKGFAIGIREQADALNDWADAALRAGGDDVAKGLSRFANRMFSSDQFAGGTRTPGLGGPAPVAGAIGIKKAEDAEKLERLETQTERINAALTAFGANMERTRIMSDLLGINFDDLGSEAKLLEETLNALAAEGLDPQDELLTMFADRLRMVRAEMEVLEGVTRLEEDALNSQAVAAGELASALGAAMEGGLGPFAKQKAKQNLLEAAELTIRATLAALTGFGAGRAGAFLQAAGRHAGIAAAWGALGASVGGTGGGAVVAGSAGAGATGSVTPTSARQSSSSSASRTEAPAGEVSIYLVGPGFDAVNPQVQRVVRGAMQEATERSGNARVRVIRQGGA